MKVKPEIWSVENMLRRWPRINPKPQYQRTAVWSVAKKQLLLDSMLRGFDLPKFYLHRTRNAHHDYDVTDGQQRLRAIHEFCAPKSELRLGLTTIGSKDLRGFGLNDLEEQHPKLHAALLNFPLHIAVFHEAESEEVRAMFARLQMGERLKPVELRHALASNLGNAIFSLVENNAFFRECAIPNKRYKHQDYVDHVAALWHYKGLRNLKAPDLRAMYIELASTPLDGLQPMLRKCNKVLEVMRCINVHKKGLFKNKWAFVDTFNLLYEKHGAYTDVHARKFCDAFQAFEALRRKHNAKPELLIEDKASASYNKDIYDYIVAFKQQGADKKNYSVRHRVFHSHFFNKDVFVLKQQKA